MAKLFKGSVAKYFSHLAIQIDNEFDFAVWIGIHSHNINFYRLFGYVVWEYII